MILNLTDK